MYLNDFEKEILRYAKFCKKLKCISNQNKKIKFRELNKNDVAMIIFASREERINYYEN